MCEKRSLGVRGHHISKRFSTMCIVAHCELIAILCFRGLRKTCQLHFVFVFLLIVTMANGGASKKTPREFGKPVGYSVHNDPKRDSVPILHIFNK